MLYEFGFMARSIFIFIFGLITGSFLNVVIYRLPENKSIITPPSHCPECGTELKYYDLFPVLSYVLTAGKCRYCGHKISLQYPLVELLTASLFLALYLKFGFTAKFGILLIPVSLLIACSFIDLKHRIIPNKLTYPGIAAGIILSIFFNHLTVISSLLGGIIPGGLLLLVALIYRRGMGLGDVKLVALLGTFLGYKFTLLGIFLGSVIGSIAGLILIAAGVMDRKTRIPFGPLIGLGTLIGLFYGNKIITIYLGFFS